MSHCWESVGTADEDSLGVTVVFPAIARTSHERRRSAPKAGRLGALLALVSLLWAAPGLPYPVAGAAVRPSGRTDVAMAYDGASKTVVLFGGHEEFADRGEELDDTWIWNGTAWKKRAPASSPPPRSVASMAYDPVSGTTLLFGGVSEVCGVFTDDSCAKLNDTWAWNGVARTWTQHLLPLSPSARSGASMAFDKVSRKIVLFGGQATNSTYLNDTWTWDGSTRTWALQTPAATPPARQRATMSADSQGRLVLFGGAPTFGATGTDTWTWNGADSTWTEQEPPISPPYREAAAMAYDGARKQAVLFSGGGQCCTELTDTWTWNGKSGTWALAATTGPPARFGAGMAYDAARQQVVLFGGSTPRTGIKNDTWIWNGTAWKLRP